MMTNHLIRRDNQDKKDISGNWSKPMTNKRIYDQPTRYLIRIQGTIDPTWSDWFGGFTITPQDGETVLEGEVNHQAALHGILAKINELGLSLISVNKLTDKRRQK
jgi:hypothetical protein